MTTCPMCFKRHRGDRYCGPACEARAAVPKGNDLLVTAASSRLAAGRKGRGADQSETTARVGNLAAIEAPKRVNPKAVLWSWDRGRAAHAYHGGGIVALCGYVAENLMRDATGRPRCKNCERVLDAARAGT